MSLHDLSKFDRNELYSNNPDVFYLQLIWLSSEEIKKETNINVLDIIEKDAIDRDIVHFTNNMFQMIENWNINEELWIWEGKYNKKVRNFINKTDWELLILWINIENIIKIRLKTGKRKFLSSLLELMEINPYEIENNLIVNYLLSISDYEKSKLWFTMHDFDVFKWVTWRAKKQIKNNKSDGLNKNKKYINLNWLKVKKMQYSKSFSYDEVNEICFKNNTRIPSRSDMEKLFEIPDIEEKLNITNSSVWCQDESGDLFIAWFKNKCFCKTSKENKLYLLEIWN